MYSYVCIPMYEFLGMYSRFPLHVRTYSISISTPISTPLSKVSEVVVVGSLLGARPKSINSRFPIGNSEFAGPMFKQTVRTDEWLDRWMDGWMEDPMDVWTDEWMHG